MVTTEDTKKLVELGLQIEELFNQYVSTGESAVLELIADLLGEVYKLKSKLAE